VARSAREGTPRGIDLATQWLKRVYKAGSRLASVPTAVQARRIEQRWALLRTRVSSLDKLLVPSRYLAQALVEFGLPADRIAHLPYGFEATRFGKRPQPLPSTARHFAFLGSVVPHKGVHVLLEAFAGQPASARLDLCGSLQSAPDYVANLQQRWRHPGIRFLGELDNDRIPGFLAQVDCLVVPSIWHENAPLVIREAHLAGLPVVASRLGGHVEMLEHGGGLLYDADSSDALANCLRRLAEEPGLLAALAQTAPPVESLESHIAELVELYSGLLRAH
jgi:glycosyltransferase involved in cell wall biosynthesis